MRNETLSSRGFRSGRGRIGETLGAGARVGGQGQALRGEAVPVVTTAAERIRQDAPRGQGTAPQSHRPHGSAGPDIGRQWRTALIRSGSERDPRRARPDRRARLRTLNRRLTPRPWIASGASPASTPEPAGRPDPGSPRRPRAEIRASSTLFVAPQSKERRCT